MSTQYAVDFPDNFGKLPSPAMKRVAIFDRHRVAWFSKDGNDIMRTGAIAKKLGMTRIYDESGGVLPVTVLQLDDVMVVAKKEVASGPRGKDKTWKLQLGAGSAKRITKPMRGVFTKVGVEPKKVLKEFKVSEDQLLEVGTEIKANHFAVGQRVDITGVTIGKGFQGGVKRHGYAGGGRASHGASLSHRALGSTGNCQDPGRVWKGKKMAGHMGARQRTAQSLWVMKIDEDRGLVFVKGAVPGHQEGWVTVQDSVKHPPVGA